MIKTPATKFRTCYNCIHLLYVLTPETCCHGMEDNLIECNFYPKGDRYEGESGDCKHHINIFNKIREGDQP